MIYVQRDAIDSKKRTIEDMKKKEKEIRKKTKTKTTTTKTKTNLTQCLYQIREVDYCIIEPVTMKRIREKKKQSRSCFHPT
jgi:uncharacterized protein YllA (UPF0747 family)